jgi:DNA-binding FadR family transcriptional regulator
LFILLSGRRCKITPEELVEEIYRCFIVGNSAGSSLPSEHKLSEYFGVSRLKIRESLKILIGKSLITSSKGRRSQIASEHGGLLDYIVTTDAASHSNWYSNLCHVRTALESEAAGLAASDYKDIDLSFAKESLLQMKVCAEEIEFSRTQNIGISDLVTKYNKADLDFHTAIVDACHNSTISIFYSSLSTLMQQSFELTQNVILNPTKNFCTNYELHSQIFENIKLGHASSAKKIIRNHMSKVNRELKLAVAASSKTND